MPFGERDARELMLGRRLTRRTAVKVGVAGTVAATVAGSSFGGIREAAAGASRVQEDPATLTVVLNGSPSDLDPHSQYDYRSTLAVRGPYEGLIGLKDDKTDEYVGLIAESWEPNQDRSVWTFRLREGSPSRTAPRATRRRCAAPTSVC